MANFEQVFNHIVLPPEIPGKQDADPDSIELDLVRRLRNACGSLKKVTGSTFQQGWELLDETIAISQRIIGGALTIEALHPILDGVAQEHGFAVLHLKEQNAALIMYRVDGPDNSDIVFEAFEAAPRLEDVTRAQDVLSWDFPSRAVRVSLEDFCSDSFRVSFASFLQKADAEQLSHLAEKIHKAGASVSEVRDVAKPHLITHMLLSVLQSMGGVAEVSVLHKRVRDDANLNGGPLPWRRLPFWLVLRVAAQRRLHLFFGKSAGYAAYKVLSCMVLSDLLRGCTARRIPIALAVLLQKKLGRKLAKLETHLEKLAQTSVTTSEEQIVMWNLVDSVAPIFKESILGASEYVEKSLAAFKSDSIRKVPKLPRRADDKDLVLSLPSSGQHLSSLLLPFHRRPGAWVAQANNVDGLPGNPSELPAVRNTAGFTKAVVDTVQTIMESKDKCAAAWRDGPGRTSAALNTCSEAQAMITSLMKMVKPHGIDNVELNSALILEAFDNWAVMDAAAVAQYPMLGEYSPIFPAALLDVLQLPDLTSMQRLRKIQRYLARRHRDSTFQSKTIFSDFDARCFATRFSSSSPELQALRNRIAEHEDALVRGKTIEWERKCEEYDQRTREMDASECTCYFERGQRQISGCLRCYKWRVRKRMKIQAMEYLLPSDDYLANAIVFELGIPELLSIYRHTTWALLTRLAYPQQPKKTSKVYKIQNGSLVPYITSSGGYKTGPVTLASSVKLFEDTHYRTVKMKAELSDVLLPLGARYRLFDTESGAFMSDFDKPLTLAHLVHVHVPESLRNTVMPHEAHPPTVPDGPSSYECVASRPKCPHSLSIHEFEAQQRLLSVKATRWLTMVVEFGSSNINFGKEDSMLVLSHLAHEAGPPSDEAEERGLGKFHAIFEDAGFVQRLLNEIEKRLSSIKDNWRETNLMTLIITLLVRVDMLADRAVHRDSVLSLLGEARSTTLRWVDSLRGEIVSAVNPEASKRASEYGFRAALLCRRTFELMQRDPSLAMSGEDLEAYIRASITMQQNLSSDANTLPAVDKAALKRDAVMAFHLKDRLYTAMHKFPDSLSSGVRYGAGLLTQDTQIFEGWTFLGGSSEGWVMSWLVPAANTSGMTRQCYAFHYTQGHLLVDGGTMGKLPDDIRASHEYKELFKERHMLTYPSAMAGMSHRLVHIICGHIVHLGQHGNNTIVLSITRDGRVFEFVPRKLFIASATTIDSEPAETYDLPRRLVDDCFHWVNHSTRHLEIRKKESKWVFKESDWAIDIPQRKARRRNVFLVDPFSRSFNLLSQVFRGFEDVQRLTVFQADSRLRAELRHLELSFKVNRDGLLQCNELGTEVDPNQDAGAFYGYQGMIVLRDLEEKWRRSIIVPLAEIAWKRAGCHISVVAKVDGKKDTSGKAYARFDIDNLLGRLTCPPEPRILYTKALLHAVTSTPLPDPLTGRTGEEEAIHTLLSGRCQPWKSLPQVCLGILGQIKDLTPSRKYYPPELRVLQKVTWSEFLPVGIQNDRYGRIIRSIVSQAYDLRRFEESGPSGGAAGIAVEDHKTREKAQANHDLLCKTYEKLMAPGTGLEIRGEIQRMRYECARVDLEPDCPVAPRDLDYLSLGHVTVPPSFDICLETKCKATLVFQIAEMLRTRPDVLPMKQKIATILDRWEVIGGFSDEEFDPNVVPLTTYMEGRFLSEMWGSLVQFCRNAQEDDLPRLTFTLAGLAFAPDTSPDALRLLAAYFYMSELWEIQPPSHDMFTGFKYNEELTVTAIMDIIEGEYTEYVAEDIEETGWRNVERIMREQRQAHLDRCRRDGKALAKHILSYWPDDEMPQISFTSDYVNVSAALEKVTGLWERLAHNRDLSAYVAEVQSAVNRVRVSLANPSAASQPAHKPRQRDIYTIPSIASHLVRCPLAAVDGLLSATQPRQGLESEQSLATATATATVKTVATEYRRPPEFDELAGILGFFATSKDIVRQKYGKDLNKSLRALYSVHKQQCGQASLNTARPSLSELNALVSDADREHSRAFSVLCSHFSESEACASSSDHARNRISWLDLVRLWPRLTPVSILELMRSEKNLQYGNGVLPFTVHYGMLLANTQRLYRLRRAVQKEDARRTAEELENMGHANWHPIEHPDWLLMEIDANMLIRDEQVTVARAMIEPQSQANSVFQLNMGKGKTSVILPMVLAVLADGHQLARMIVPKTLILPTAHVIQSRLGGLVGRQVQHLSFSRRLLSADDCDSLLACYKETHNSLVASRGMLIAAPEHILAFKLCGLQCLADGKTALGTEMVAFQTELEQTLCRDILDESDYTLAVRTQLVYPSGDLTAVDGAPYRWQLVQQLLSLIEDHAIALSQKFPAGLKVDRRGTGFPTIHILQQSIENVLHERLVHDVCDGRIPLFRLELERIAPDAAKRLRRKKAKNNPRQLLELALVGDDAGSVAKAAALFADVKAVEAGLLLVRGLIKHSILITCLKKRWNVQYGLHPGRWPIAVPFEARGVPSERSEFGHPDVSIIFTCLAFYYDGVNLDQFRKSLEHVLHHVDDPATEYEKWSSGDGHTTIPPELQNWNSINVDDQGQVEKLWSHLRLARSVINHYLNKFVFPQHSRQFSVKLQASAWDLPLIVHKEADGDAATGARTTGFSGTNDNKSMLPLTIKQDDLPGFSHTNAEVSAYFLQNRNREYVCTRNGNKRWTEEEFVRSLKHRKIRVLIDAGAYILELSNEALARAWLRVAEGENKAAVFFDEKDNRAMVVFREASAAKVPLVSSPYADRLDECLVYFDEAHTRGVDLQLPPNARGALTLALGQTRDHTAQAALRLRQLATTQSVVFYAPPEVDQSIRDVFRAHHGFDPPGVGSPHVVAWLLEQTCRANEQLSSLYAAHGRDFCRRTDAMWKHRYSLGESTARDALLAVLEQPERQTLETMYGDPASTAASTSKAEISDAQLQEYMATLRQGQASSRRSSSSGSFAVAHGAFEEVEQEREVEVQVEEEDIPERRVSYQALSFPGVADAIRNFVQTGVIAEGNGCRGALASIALTNIGKRHLVRTSGSRLFVSNEYSRTVKAPRKGLKLGDDFLRPTEWLLWCPKTEAGIVVISEELEELLPLVVQSKRVHLVTYAAAVTRSMLDFSSLQFLSYPPLPKAYVFPPWLAVEMGILAGRLYMRYDEAKHMRAYLEDCVREEDGGDGEGDGDGNGDGDDEWTKVGAGFCSDPSSFLLEWLPLRRTAQDILYTPAAYICQGRPLRRDHAFFIEDAQRPGMDAAKDASGGDQTSPGGGSSGSGSSRRDSDGSTASGQTVASQGSSSHRHVSGQSTTSEEGSWEEVSSAGS